MPTRTCLLILAAGSSSRMGQPKQLLPLGETTLLGHAIKQALATQIGPVHCVLGAHADSILPTITSFPIGVITNPDWAKGMSTSIVAGVVEITKQLPEITNILILLGDQPLVDYKYLLQLKKVSADHPQNVIASQYPHGIGVPALFPKNFFQQLLLLEGDKGARQLLKQLGPAVVPMEASGLLLDIDRQEDYEQFLKISKGPNSPNHN